MGSFKNTINDVTNEVIAIHFNCPKSERKVVNFLPSVHRMYMYTTKMPQEQIIVIVGVGVLQPTNGMTLMTFNSFSAMVGAIPPPCHSIPQTENTCLSQCWKTTEACVKVSKWYYIARLQSILNSSSSYDRPVPDADTAKSQQCRCLHKPGKRNETYLVCPLCTLLMIILTLVATFLLFEAWLNTPFPYLFKGTDCF